MMRVIVTLPAASPASARKKVCDVERRGDDLSILMATEIGDVRTFVPLTAAADWWKLASAKLTEGELLIPFIRA
jgi:hypothetical protein